MAAGSTTFYKNDGTDIYTVGSFMGFPTVESLGWLRDRYMFASWNTRADGTGVSFAEGSSDPTPDETGYGVYYAIWKYVPTYLDFDGLSTYDSLIKTEINGKVDADAVMVVLEYGVSTWDDFLAAYEANRLVYCRVDSTYGPRMAFLAFRATSGNNIMAEFQYYRSVLSHTASQQGDEIYIYTLKPDNTWTTTVRKTYTQVVAGSGLKSAYANEALTLSNDAIYELPPATASTLGGVKVGDGLTVASDGTASIADGAVTDAKLADRAVTNEKLANGAVTTAKLAYESVTTANLDLQELENNGSIVDVVTSGQRASGGIPFKLIAADATSQAIAQRLGGGELPPILTPADLDTDRKFMYDAYMLVWLNDTVIEGARLRFYGVLNGNNVIPYVYAKGNGSIASGILGFDESWTITALPTDAEGESASELVMDALSAIATPDGPVATANHAANTYLTMQGKLYKVTSAIASGEQIVSGTNVTETTVMDGTRMVVLEYGKSTWNDFLAAYNTNKLVYCQVPVGSTGQRMAFLAYVSGKVTTPTFAEFQYYRSMEVSKYSATQQGDEVYVYTLKPNNT